MLNAISKNIVANECFLAAPGEEARKARQQARDLNLSKLSHTGFFDHERILLESVLMGI